MAGVVRAIISPLNVIDKDLGRITLTIVAIGANFIPGGQPFAAAAALALATLYKPKGPKPEQQQQSIKTALPPRISAYGRVRLYWAYILYVTNDDGFAVDVGAYHDGLLDGIERYYLGSKQVWINGSGFVYQQDDGEFGDADTIQIGFNLGLPTESAFSQVISRLPDIWTENHRGDGVATGYMISKPVKAKNYAKVYPGGGPDANAPSIVARAQRVFDWRDPEQDPYDSSTWKWSANAALCTAHYYLTRMAKDWDTHFAPTLSYWTAFANDCDAPVAVYHGSGASVSRVEEGDYTITITSAEGLEIGKEVTFAGGTEVNTVSAIDDLAITFSAPFVQDYDRGTMLTWIGGGVEARYRVALAHKHTDAHKVTIGNLLACCDGFVAPRGDGALVAYSGRYVEPDPDDLIGPAEIVNWSWDDGIVDEDQINEIAVSYISPDHDYGVVDTDAWRDEDAIMEAGEVKPTTLENSVPSHGQARRLAKRLMDKTMAPYRGSITTNPKGKKIRGKRFIPLHIEEAGTVFYSGPAEIVRLKRTQTGVQFDWVRANPNIDAWNPATEEGEPAPVGAKPATIPLSAPVITDAEAELGEGGANARLRITVDGFDRDDVTWYARWRITTDVSWNDQEYSDVDPGPTAVLITSVVPTDVSIDVEVSYSVGDGRPSPWSDLVSVSTSTAGLAPSPPTDVTGSGGTGTALIAWINATSANLSYSRVYRNSTNTIVGAALASGDLASAAGATQEFTDTIGAGTYYYFVRGFSASGTPSGATGSGAVTVA
ncbi:hypothetical protein [Sphingobium sp.]|uniref:hypothetical protein n=1 Tax=Sphingobium sp. TaxID=1912891 RepID=UPI000DB3693C|nr:hypothetical protein [Sphingobium sp.]PZU65255.1 MAG: hypothetical protein DI540_17965 [Sphingobium sp.]